MNETQNPEENVKPKRHWLRKFLKYTLACILLLFLAAGGGVWWLCQTASGQAWLVKNVNSALELKPGAEGLGFKIISLSGSLPFNFKIGLEAYDGKGLWLSAPDNAFTLNWRELPGKLHISTLMSSKADLSRFPELPETSPPAEPEKPFTLADVNPLLAKLHDFLKSEHWWMPEILIENAGVTDFTLPADLVPQSPPKRTTASLGLGATFIKNILSAQMTMGLVNSNADPIDLKQFSMAGINGAIDLKLTPEPEELVAVNSINFKVAAPRFAIEELPADYAGNEIDLSLDVKARALHPEKDGELQIDAAGPNISAGKISLNTHGDWRSGKKFNSGELDGPLNYKLGLKVEPAANLPVDSPLAMLRDPVKLDLDIEGNLPKIKLDLNLACAKIIKDKYSLEDLALVIHSEEIDLPLGQAIANYLHKENQIQLTLTGNFDKNPLKLATLLFFQQLEETGAWDCGLKNLKLALPGVSGDANLDARISAGADPEVRGNVDLSITDWKLAAMFIPDQSFGGKVDLHAKLAPGSGHGDKTQNADASLDIERFTLSDKSGQVVALKSLKGTVTAQDIFRELKFDANIALVDAKAAGMNIGANLAANGALKGPIGVKLSTVGNVKTNIAAQWEPGKATVQTLDVDVNLPDSPLKKIPLAIHSRKPAQVIYGESGIKVQNLDLELSPTGKLTAQGEIGKDSLDFNLNLAEVNFKPWQALVPQIPGGSASLEAALSGTPARPAGKFTLVLKDISIPGTPLKPITTAVRGKIENAGPQSSLKIALDVDPATLKNLGSTKAHVGASIPLAFAENGIPNIAMTKPFGARIAWDGALGPIWNLLPMPDKRLNGRLDININASGTLSKPLVKGGAKIEKARFEDLLLGILLTDINLNLDLLEDQKLSAMRTSAIPGSARLLLTASDGYKGTVTVNGSASLNGDNLDVTAKINHLKPLRRRDVHIELSGDAKVAGSATEPQVTGQIIVNQGEVLLDNLDIGGSVTTLPISNPSASKKQEKEAPKTSADAKGSGKLDIKITMLPRFIVEGRGLTSIWKANLLVGGTPQHPQITGNISSVKGNFDFLGKNFGLTKGIVFFGGGEISNPLLDIELTNETPDLTAHIIITGPVSKMKLTLTSDPSLPRDEILSQVLFGKNMSDLSRLEALQLAGAVAQLAGFGSGAGGILTFAKKALGVDVLRLGTASEAAGQPGEETASGTTLEMGKYINDMIYMGVQQGMKADSTAFIIQMELTPRTSLEVRTEQNNTWGGIKWKYNY